MNKINIAIDGYSSCGKSTMARNLAREIGYVYVDTGAMYRAVTLYALRRHIIREDGSIDIASLREAISKDINISFRLIDGHPQVFLNEEPVESLIRTMEVSAFVSQISSVAFVREALVSQQRQIGKAKGVVMDGRDIGTTVFPDAELKIFVTASAAVRAQRRLEELRAKGMTASLPDIEKNITDRDYQDTHRQTSPLRQAPDAIVLDNSHMSIHDQHLWLLNLYHVKLSQLFG